MKKKTIIALVAAVLVVAVAVGTTLAWLTASTDTVKNTFTYGSIQIKLEETTGDEYKMIPGSDLEKDPLVTVIGGSEACYLFVKIEATENFGDFMTYEIAEGWTAIADSTTTHILYRTVEASDADQEFAILADNKVTVLGEVTADDFAELGEDGPELSFTAYAVQLENVASAEDAWAIIGD